MGYPGSKESFESPPTRDQDVDLVIRVFWREGQAIYAVKFARIAAFRALDEGGLLELWEETHAQGGCPTSATFKVRNHKWSKESPLAFAMSPEGLWSYVIATGNDCVEVVAFEPPEIVFERKIRPQPWDCE